MDPRLEMPWYLNGDRKTLAVYSAIIAAVVFAVTELFHWIIDPGDGLLSTRCLADLIAAIVIGYLAYRFLAATLARRQALLDRFAAIGELNHDIRNALEVISLSAQMTKDSEAIARIGAATSKISWALKDAAPNAGTVERPRHRSRRRST